MIAHWHPLAVPVTLYCLGHKPIFCTREMHGKNYGRSWPRKDHSLWGEKATCHAEMVHANQTPNKADFVLPLIVSLITLSTYPTASCSYLCSVIYG